MVIAELNKTKLIIKQFIYSINWIYINLIEKVFLNIFIFITENMVSIVILFFFIYVFDNLAYSYSKNIYVCVLTKRTHYMLLLLIIIIKIKLAIIQ